MSGVFSLEEYPDVMFVGDRRLLSIHPDARIDAWVKIEIGQGVWIGNGVHIASFCHLNVGGGGMEMNSGSCIASGSRIITGSSISVAQSRSGMSASPAANDYFGEVEKTEFTADWNSSIGAGCTILPGARYMGPRSILAAGSVLTKEIHEGEVWVGIPAEEVDV